MFENNITQRRLLKRKSIMDEIEKAKEEQVMWKVNQLESKLYDLNQKYFPNVFWNSNEKGTYRKEESKNGN